MNTRHLIYFGDSRDMKPIDRESVDLVVTSPPYPMIEMWDRIFIESNPAIAKALDDNRPDLAFEMMHQELDPVWDEVCRVLKPGGMVCINIGDATRTVHQVFALYVNHARILRYFIKKGMVALPSIIWRKQTNAPNKFMGSGMLPPGAYVTLEHEHILILRKEPRRLFSDPKGAARRKESAYFWEERNQWFSDVWMDLKGTSQSLNAGDLRKRSAAFPFELPYRLIHMFSVKGDVVLDPFLGTGTTTFAAMSAGRNSVGFEKENQFLAPIKKAIPFVRETADSHTMKRLRDHEAFVLARIETGYSFKHTNVHYGFPVMTSQEKDLLLNPLLDIQDIQDIMDVRDLGGHAFEATYADRAPDDCCRDWTGRVPDIREDIKKTNRRGDDNGQMKLLD